MEALVITLITIVIAGIGYIAYLLHQKDNQEESVKDFLQQVDTSVQLKLAEGLNGLNNNLAIGLEKGATALKSTQGENLETTQTLMQKILQQVDKRMDDMSQSFGQISKANDFMRMLFNPSARGHVGEVQLETLLADILGPTQYEKNFKPIADEDIRVEFAVKMPTDIGSSMYLPIDSKFPKEEYERLNQAETKDELEAAKRALISKVKEFGKQISKYINEPVTTDMAIMYLPDGIYEWVVSQPELVNHLRKEKKVVVAGPTTLWTMISFVSHFFRVIAINDQSEEVMNLLGKFKKQMRMTLEVVDKAIRNNEIVGKSLEELKGVRFNQMMRELRDVEERSEDKDNDQSDQAA